MKGKEKEKSWGFHEKVVKVEGDTIRDVLQSILVFSELGVKVVITDFLGILLLEEDLEKGDLPHFDKEAFVLPTGPRLLVPQPLDKEGKRLLFKGTYIPSLLIVPKCKTGLLMEYPLLDHPYYVWTEVPDWILERMEVASPMTAEVHKADGEVKA